MPSTFSNLWQARWTEEYDRAVKANSQTRTVVPARKNDLRVWKGYLKTREGQLHSMEIRLEYAAQKDRRTLFYPLSPPKVEWQTPIRHPNIQPPRPLGDGIPCLKQLQPESWNPKTHISELLNYIEVLVNSPNPSDPINHPTCLEVAISTIRQQARASNAVTNVVEPKLKQAEGLIRKYAPRWNSMKTVSELHERDRAWYLVVESGKYLSANVSK